MWELPYTLWTMERRWGWPTADPLKWVQIRNEIRNFTGFLSWL